MSTSPSLANLQAAFTAGEISSSNLAPLVAPLTPEELAELLLWLRHDDTLTKSTEVAGKARVLNQLVAILETQFLRRPPASEPSLRDAVRELYMHLPGDFPHRGGLLRVLAAMAGAEELGLLAELLATDPPTEAEDCALALAPLFRRKKFAPGPLFPRLLDSLPHVQVAPAVLDLCNYLTREKFVEKHPATDRSEQLAILLGEVSGRLMTIEQRREAPDAETQRQVREGVGLAVALCDALAQIGNPETIGKLRQALGVTHRRIHTEAAYALAKLDQEEGRELLAELAAEPFARLRVLAYAQELGMLASVEEEHRTPQAVAEAELATWLAEPLQMGMPPHRIELLDHQEMYWPGFDDLVNCYLFRFSYEFPGGELSNIGIAGPLTMAFSADLSTLPADTMYAAFAGWQAEHADIFETPRESLAGAALRQAEQQVGRLSAAEFGDIEPMFLGTFFEHRVLVAEASREGVRGIVLIDEEQIDWWPTAGMSRPLGAREAYSIYKGKRLLETFNP